MAITDSEKVALAKKVEKEMTVDEVEAQLYRLEAMGPQNEEQQRLVHWAVEAGRKLGGAFRKTCMKGF